MKKYQSPNLKLIVMELDVICTSGEIDPGKNDIFYV